MTLTLPNIPLELDAALRRKAAEEHRPVDQVAVEAMRAGLGLRGSGPDAAAKSDLAASIRAIFAPLGGVEPPDPVREPMREPPDFAE